MFWTGPGLGLGSIVSSQNISGHVHVCLKQHVPSIDKNISQQWLYAFKLFPSGDPLWAVARVQSSDMTLNLLVDPILDRQAKNLSRRASLWRFDFYTFLA